MKKLIQIIPYRFWGGPEIQIFQLATQLQKNKFATFTIIAYASPHCAESDLYILKSKAHEFQIDLEIRNSPRLSALKTERNYLAKRISSENFSGLVSSGYLCDLLAVLQNTKSVSVVHGWTSQNLKVRFYEKLNQLILRFFAGVACVSAEQQKFLKARNVKAILIPNSLAIPKEIPFTRSEVFRELGIPEDHRLLLTIGRLSSEKGHGDAINAFTQLASSFLKLDWVFIGDGPEIINLKKQTINLGLEKRIHFLGKQDFAWKWLPAADLFVLPSHREGLPVVLLEAFSQRVPVVATDVGGVKQLVQNEKTGLLIPPQNPKILASAIAWALSNDQTMNQMKLNAYLELITNFTVENQAQLFEKFLTQVFDA